MKSIFAFLSSIFLLTTCAPAVSQANDNTAKNLTHLYNARYCEVIVVKRVGFKLDAAIYNTINLNDCPVDLWSKLDVAALTKQFDATAVKLNGPRYFVMDALTASGSTTNAPVTTIGGIQFKERATLKTNVWNGSVGNKLYTPNKVKRYTVWIYNPGTTIYELVSPQGEIYVMQSYSQMIDSHLQLSDLPHLGQKLKLPVGWRFQTRNLDQSLELKANGVAYVINDNLYNSY